MDDGESVGFGWTGPSVRSDAAKSGSEPSRSTASEREVWARGGGWTLGPVGRGCDVGGAGVGPDGALEVEGGAVWGARVGYLRAAAPAVARVALDAEAPIVASRSRWMIESVEVR